MLFTLSLLDLCSVRTISVLIQCLLHYGVFFCYKIFCSQIKERQWRNMSWFSVTGGSWRGNHAEWAIALYLRWKVLYILNSMRFFYIAIRIISYFVVWYFVRSWCILVCFCCRACGSHHWLTMPAVLFVSNYTNYKN